MCRGVCEEGEGGGAWGVGAGVRGSENSLAQDPKKCDTGSQV